MPQQIDVPGMGVVEFPDGMSDDQIVAAIRKNSAPPQSAPMDFLKSIPAGAMNTLTGMMYGAGIAGASDTGEPASTIPQPQQIQSAIEQNVTGPTYVPQGRAGKFGQAVGEAVSSPLTYLGPGGIATKGLSAVAGALGSEGAGQAAQGTKYEGAARIAGALAGGVTPSGVRAIAAPTADALRSASEAGYDAARNMGVDIKSSAVKGFADTVRQSLEQDGVNGKLAPKTFGIIDELQNPPAGSVATISNLDTVRRTLGNAAKDFNNPTEQLAASRVQRALDEYLSTIPGGDVLSGDAQAASKTLSEARGNYAAAKRSEQVTDAVEAGREQAATANSGRNVDNAVRQKIRSILLNDRRNGGYSSDELDQMRRVSRGTVTGNTSRYIANLLGGGGGLGQFLTGMGTAAGTLGGYLLHGPEGGMIGGGTGAALAASLPGAGAIAKSVSNASTLRQSRILDELVRSRSPLAQSQGVGQSLSPAQVRTAAIIRALLEAQDRQPNR